MIFEKYRVTNLYFFIFVITNQLTSFSFCLEALQTECHSIAVIGTGYVGLVSGACLAEFNNNVICVDIDERKITLLRQGEIPIYEQGLKELVNRNQKNQRLEFSIDIKQSIQKSEIILVCVDTPIGKNGEADLTAVHAVAKMIGENLNSSKTIFIKSTVPIGSIRQIASLISHYNNNHFLFELAYLPEFLREGSSVRDFMEPERIIVGTESEMAKQLLIEILSPIYKKNIPFVFTTIEAAETIKYVSNCFLAVKVSFINEIANLCDRTGVDIFEVSKGVGLDSRIGSKFLNPGPGYGGSCFPKDMLALIHQSQKLEIDLKIIKAAVEANETQHKVILDKLKRALNFSVAGKTIGILGLTFKANTGDIRESPALKIIDALLREDAFIKAYDPVAMENTRNAYPQLLYANSIYDAVQEADAVMILTEWEEFKEADWEYVRSLMKQAIVIDARNLLSIEMLDDLGFIYDNVGRSNAKKASNLMQIN